MQVADALSSIYIFIQVFAVMPYVRCGLNTRVYDHCETVQNTKHVAAVQFKKNKIFNFHHSVVFVLFLINTAFQIISKIIIWNYKMAL